MKKADRNLRTALRLLDLGLAPIPCWTPAECAARKCSTFRRPRDLAEGRPWEAPEKCDRPGKHPRVPWKELQSAPPPAEQVHEWFRRWKDANIAMPTGSRYNLVVVDADSPAALAWCDEHLRSPLGSITGIRDLDTLWRGRQIYMGHPGGSIRNKAKLKTPDGKLDLDIRADGGYVMIPGSAHPSGVEYEAVGPWTREAFASLPKIDVALIPGGRGKGEASAMDRARAYAKAKGPAIEGSGGDAHTYQLANDLVRGFCLTDGEALSVLREWNGLCLPPWSDRELEQKINNARRYGTGEFGYLLYADRQGYRPSPPQSSRTVIVLEPAKLELPAPEHRNGSNGGVVVPEGTAPWPPIVPLGIHRVPDFPIECLPESVRGFVEQKSTEKQTPLALAAMCVLCVGASAVAKKCRIEVRPGWQEPLNLYAAVVAPPAARKSQVMTDCKAPLEDYQAELAERAASDIHEARVRAKVKASAAEQAAKRAARGGENRQALEQEAIQLAKEAEEFRVPAIPRLLTDDVTAEKLSNMLAQHAGRIAIFSAEGGIFDLMAGRYSQNAMPNFEVYLKAHAGDTLIVDRMTRSDYIREPALTLCLGIQPDVVRGLGSRPSFRGRGLLGRFLYAVPDDNLGTRRVDAPEVSGIARQRYRQAVRHLLDLPIGDSRVAGVAGAPFLLVLSPEARSMLRDFEAWIEPQLGVFGDLGAMPDWGGKLAGAAARITGVLHLLEHAGERMPWTVPVSVGTAASALGVVEFLIPHARLAYQEMETDEGTGAAKMLLRWIERQEGRGFTQRDAHRATQARFKSVEHLQGAISVLEGHGYIRQEKDREKSGKGRPTVKYAVHPDLNSVISVNCHKGASQKWEGAYKKADYKDSNRPLVTGDINDNNAALVREPGEEG